MKLGSKQAIEILEEIAADLGLTLLLWHTPTRTETAALLRAAKVEFVVRARKKGIYINTIAEILGCDRMTVMTLADPRVKARRNAQQRRAAAVRRARMLKPRTSDWSVPVFHRALPIGTYTGWEITCLQCSNSPPEPTYQQTHPNTSWRVTPTMSA